MKSCGFDSETNQLFFFKIAICINLTLGNIMVFIDLNNFYQFERSLTKRCVQYGWAAKYYFPHCPEEIEINPIEAYFQNFKIGAVFAYNDDSPKLIVVEFARIKNSVSILVMCEREGITSEREGFKPWLIAKITSDSGSFIHSNLGSYFEKEDAEGSFHQEKMGIAGKLI